MRKDEVWKLETNHDTLAENNFWIFSSFIRSRMDQEILLFDLHALICYFAYVNLQYGF